MDYFVYILKSQKTKRFYIGYTTNLEIRLKEHNVGMTRSTKPFRPWKIIYFEKFLDKNKAFKREWHLKHPAGYLEKLEIIKKNGGFA
ncbi:MAG: GIY-YIG nuclease family protein [Patescibacteria group bacterium]